MSGGAAKLDPTPSFDHLVRAGKHRGRHGEAQHERRLRVDDELELARLHDRQIRGLRAFEDAAPA